MAGPWERFAQPAVAPTQAAGPWTRFAQPAVEPQRDLSVAETAADVAKSAGIGLVQGGIGLATLPGNIEQLGRMGINAASRGLGGNDLVSNDAALPTYQDAKGAIEGYTGEFYQPQTTLGEYARTIGEFAPVAVGGGAGLVGRVANVMAPAIMSETAGQLTKGTAYEPYARVAGSLAGGVLPRGVTPLPADPTRTAMVKALEKDGVTALTAGQKTGSERLRYFESTTQHTPGGGARAANMATQQEEQFTRAALKRAGVSADRATPDVMNQAFDDIGRKFDSLANTSNMTFDPPLTRALQSAANDYNQMVPPSMRAPVVDNVLQDIATMAQQNGGKLPGSSYQAVRSRLDRMRRDSRDPQLSRALGDMREALDDAMQRSMPTPRAGEWSKVRREYKNLIVLEKAVQGAGEKTALGLISPAQLRMAAKQQNKRAYVRGTDDLGPLARAGEAIMKPLPNSGTAPRQGVQNAMAALGAAGGSLYAGAPGAAIGAIGAAALPAVASRMLMSRPFQNYMANQRAASVIAERPRAALNAMLAPQIAAEHGGLVGQQTTGVYPPGDPRWFER